MGLLGRREIAGLEQHRSELELGPGHVLLRLAAQGGRLDRAAHLGDGSSRIPVQEPEHREAAVRIERT